jgi:hypothetical protein
MKQWAKREEIDLLEMKALESGVSSVHNAEGFTRK